MADWIQCADCGETFEFSDGEQEFFKARGYTPPKRCKSCRKAKKERFGDRDEYGKD